MLCGYPGWFAIAPAKALPLPMGPRNDKLAPADDEAPPEKKIKGEQVVSIQVGNSQVSILCPAKRAQSADLLVLLHVDHLAPIFNALSADCTGDDSKRHYHKSGKFAKPVLKD